jgi:hypothetical protein
MKKVMIFILAAVMVLGLALAAQAVTINDPNNGEMHLYQIVADAAFGGLTGFSSSQDFADAFPIVQTLPANGFGPGSIPYKMNAFAKFAAYTQDPGVYNSSGTTFLSFFSTDFPLTANGIFTNLDKINLRSAKPFAFVDGLNRSANTYDYLIYTEPAMNQGGLENGVILQIGAGHWIVAFEDGKGAGSLGDQDYNDLVINVSRIPVPPSALLFSSGLLGLGLAGWRRRLLG